jgi:hypothetical protein
MGCRGLKDALAERKVVAGLLRDRIGALAASHGERLLVSRGNPISFAMSIDAITGRLVTPVAPDPSASASSELPLAAGPAACSSILEPVVSAASTTCTCCVTDAAAAALAPSVPAVSIGSSGEASSAIAGGVGSGGSGCERGHVRRAYVTPQLASAAVPSAGPLGPTYLGSMLFSRGVSGTRVVSPGEVCGGQGIGCDIYTCVSHKPLHVPLRH